MSGDCLVLVDMEEVAPHKSPENDECCMVISPPAPKKLKQACLPFKNMLSKPAPISVTPAKKRKRSSDASMVMQKSPRIQRVEKSDDDSSRKVMASKVCNTDNEVSSSSWNENTDCEKMQNYNGPKSRTSAGPLDNYLRTTQQREVSTSVQDDEAVVDLTDTEVNCAVKPDNSHKTVIDNEDCTKIVTDKITEEDKENVASVVTIGSAPCEKDDKTKSDCTKREGKSEVCSSACHVHENQAEESSDDKKGDKQLTDMDASVQSDSLSSGGILPATSADTSGDCSESLNSDTLVDSSIIDEVTPKKSDIATDSATSISSSTTESTPVTSQSSQSVTGPTTPVSSTKFKTPKSSNRKRNPETLRKIQEKEQDKLDKQRQREELRTERERQKAEKEKQRVEEKEKKAKVKQMKEREKQEQKEQKEKEKDEKQRQKEEERKKKEEERKKKQDILDVKNEEKKKKEEERKKKEDEKQKMEDDKNRKKQKESIQNFFIKRTSSPPKQVEDKKGLFMAFEVKKGMRLAPLHRAVLDSESHSSLDRLLETQDSTRTFVEECKIRPARSTPQTWPSNDQDVEIVEADSEMAPLKPMKVKLLQFCENYRPAYYGTWRKKSKYVCPRNLLKKDKDLLDYEVDSDEEWEEEEPGESLSHSEGEDGDDADKDNDSEDEDGFFVPHGYLSEGEGCEDEEEEMSVEKRKAVQLARTKKWEMDRTKKCEALKRMCIGVSWWSPDTATEEDPMQMVLAKFHAVLLTSTPIAVERPVTEKKEQVKEPAKKGCAIRSVPEAALPHLVKLIHGNVCSIQKLVKEFREYWSRHTATDSDMSITDKGGDVSVAEKDGDVSMTENNVSVAGCSNGDVSVTDADGDMSMIDKDGDTSVVDKDGDILMVDRDGDTSMTDKDADTSMTDKDGNTKMIDKNVDMSLTEKDGDTSLANNDGDIIPTDASLNASHTGSPGGADSSIKTVSRYTFSKRQLDKTIRKLGVYEKRAKYEKFCWYVHQHLLEKYSLTDLPIPTQWQWLTRPNVAPAKKKKLMAPRDRNSSTPVRSNTPTIKRFAVPNMKPVVNPVRKRPQFSATITSPGGCKSPIVIDDDNACAPLAAASITPSGERVVSNTVSVSHLSSAVLTQLPQVSTSGDRAETQVCEDSDNSLVLHFSESESGTTGSHPDQIVGQVAFPKFPLPPSSGQSSGREKGKERVKPRRVMPTLLSMFSSQTKSQGTSNGTAENPAISKSGTSNSTPIEID